MATGRPILIDRAGPSGMPAAVLHPDDPLPKTWRILSTWTYRGQRGAWLEWNGPGYRQPQDPRTCHVIYRTGAKRAPRVTTTGQGLCHAARALICAPWHLSYASLAGYREPSGTAMQRGMDQAARQAFLGLDWLELTKRDKAGAQAYAESLSQSTPPAPAAPASTDPAPSQRPVEAPPQPGVERARWLGERITEMTGRERSNYLPHTRRRIAAHRALSYVTGDWPTDPENDGRVLSGSLSLHLEGLNAYAGRVFAGEQEPIGGTDDAVL